jgi:hypothetical protein
MGRVKKNVLDFSHIINEKNSFDHLFAYREKYFFSAALA